MQVKVTQLPSQNYLRECFGYDETTGVLTWKERPLTHFKAEARRKAFNTRYAGKPLSARDNRGYIVTSLDTQKLKGHRVIWKLFYGEEPPPVIDHLNSNKSDNRISNLKAVTQLENLFNKQVQRNNKLGVKGVSFDTRRQKFYSRVKIGAKIKWLGYFDNQSEAEKVYQEACRNINQHLFQRGGVNASTN